MINLFTLYFMIKTDAEWYWYLIWFALICLQIVAAIQQHQDKQRREAAFELAMMGGYQK